MAGGAIYEEPSAASRVDLAAARLSGDDQALARTLVGVVLHDDDWRWCQNQCLELSEHPSLDIRRVSLTCLGHIARIHGHLDLDLVVPKLNGLRSDPLLGGTADDALDDIALYLGK